MSKKIDDIRVNVTREKDPRDPFDYESFGTMMLREAVERFAPLGSNKEATYNQARACIDVTSLEDSETFNLGGNYFVEVARRRAVKWPIPSKPRMEIIGKLVSGEISDIKQPSRRSEMLGFGWIEEVVSFRGQTMSRQEFLEINPVIRHGVEPDVAGVRLTKLGRDVYEFAILPEEEKGRVASVRFHDAIQQIRKDFAVEDRRGKFKIVK